MNLVGPLTQQLYADPILTSFSVGWEPGGFIADTLFPEVQVTTKTGIYYQYDRQDQRPTNDIRAPGTRAQVVRFGYTQVSYGPLLDHSLDAPIEWETTQMAAAPLDPAFDATKVVTNKLTLNKEIDAYNQCTNTGVVTQNVTVSGTSRWDDYANSDPIADLRLAINTVKAASSKPTTELTIMMPYEVFDTLKNHPQFVEKIKYTGLGVLTTDILKQLFDVKQVIVAHAQYDSANPGQADVMNYIWGKHAWVFYLAEKAALRQPSFGYTLRWGGRKVFRYTEQAEETDYVRAKDYYQQFITAAGAVYYLATVIN